MKFVEPVVDWSTNEEDLGPLVLHEEMGVMNFKNTRVVSAKL